MANSLSFSPDGAHLATGSQDKLAIVWSLPGGGGGGGGGGSTDEAPNMAGGHAGDEGASGEMEAPRSHSCDGYFLVV